MDFVLWPQVTERRGSVGSTAVSQRLGIPWGSRWARAAACHQDVWPSGSVLIFGSWKHQIRTCSLCVWACCCQGRPRALQFSLPKVQKTRVGARPRKGCSSQVCSISSTSVTVPTGISWLCRAQRCRVPVFICVCWVTSFLSMPCQRTLETFRHSKIQPWRSLFLKDLQQQPVKRVRQYQQSLQPSPYRDSRVETPWFSSSLPCIYFFNGVNFLLSDQAELFGPFHPVCSRPAQRKLASNVYMRPYSVASAAFRTG